MRPFKLIFVVTLLLEFGCGYRFAGQRMNGGAGRTIAVPTFINRSATYRIEQQASDAVRQELVKRTRFEVTSKPSGDVVVSGEVLGYGASPVLFNEQGRASSYAISVTLKISVVDTSSGMVLFRNDNWAFREVFELAQTSGDFVPEEPAAVDRMMQRFASTLVASLINRPR